jgi:integrase
MADGRTKYYHYAWRGGPRLAGEPGSPEFMLSYHTAHSTRRTPNKTLFQSIIADYRSSREFANLGARTKIGYLAKLRQIESKFGDLPVTALDDPRITRVFKDWRNSLAKSPRQADYAWTVLMLLISWAREDGRTTYRPPERLKKLHTSDRSEKVWEESHIASFMAVASEPLQHALVVGIETGQRQTDILSLTWSAYDGQFIRLIQAKSRRHNSEGTKVTIPVTRTLRALLDRLPRTATNILLNDRGEPWLRHDRNRILSANSFRKAWSGAARKAGITDLHFHDLRGTTVTRLAEAECTIPEIASITGHSLREASSIIGHYMARRPKLAIAAIAKLERGRSGT